MLPTPASEHAKLSILHFKMSIGLSLHYHDTNPEFDAV